MKRREFVASMLGVIGVAAVSRGAGQAVPTPVGPPLGVLAERSELQLFGREAHRLVDGDRDGVRLSEAPGEGAAFLRGSDFANGNIELDIRGRDLAQRSFVGIAFHAVDTSACDAIYFRPFNFRATDPMSRSHAVQYHSMPRYSWQRLRAEQPGKFEQAVTPVPDPNDWFHARIVVAGPTASVFVADAKEPCLRVNLLSERKSGLVGLWVGNNSGGDFASLVITAA